MYWFLALTFLACAPWASAQTYSRQEAGVGLSAVSNTPTTFTVDGPTSSYHLYAGPLARYTWNLSPSLALEGDVSFHFGNRNTFTTVNDGDLQATGGVKAGWRGKHFGIFEEVKPGLTWYYNGIEEIYPSIKFSDVRYFTLKEGAVVELYPARRLIWRLDVDQTLVAQFDQTQFQNSSVRSYLAGAVPPHLSLSIGASYRLGELRDERESVPRKGAVDVGVFFPLQIREHLENQDLRPDRGVGGWFSVPVSRCLSLDAAGFRLPQDDQTYYAQDGGPATEVLGGLKAGIRRDRIGYFAKARPGLARFDHGLAELGMIPPSTYTIRGRPIDNFAWDTGGVFEVYPSTHTMLRVDAGNVFIHYHAETVTAPSGNIHYPPVRKSSLLFAFGAGWRF